MSDASPYQIECSNLKIDGILNCLFFTYFSYIDFCLFFIKNVDCKDENALMINYVCYYLFIEKRAQSPNAMNEYCNKRNMSLADYPTFQKQNLIEFFLQYKQEFGKKLKKSFQGELLIC